MRLEQRPEVGFLFRHDSRRQNLQDLTGFTC
jgi:hypothetical protein